MDFENGLAELFVDGVIAETESFDPNLRIKNDIESEWIIGSGTISSKVDEMRISSQKRSADWVLANFQNQKENPTFPSTPNALIGSPSFTSAS